MQSRHEVRISVSDFAHFTYNQKKLKLYIKVVSENFIIASKTEVIDFWWIRYPFDLLIQLPLSLYGHGLLWHWHVTNVDLNVCNNKRLEKINLKTFRIKKNEILDI